MLFWKSPSLDPSFNLAIEESLFETGFPDDYLLLLWINEPSVIIGRNQNAFLECDIEFVRKKGIHLIRRMTGGGAVYQDKGNLNYSFFSKKDKYDRSLVNECILDALSFFGIDAKTSGRNDLTIDGYKFSGTAFRSNEFIVLHHGTLMCDVDTAVMERALTGHSKNIFSKSLPSTKSRVRNLSFYSSNVSVEELGKSVFRSFSKKFSGAEDYKIDKSKLKQYFRKYKSEDWNLFLVSDYVFQRNFVFDWGNVTISIDYAGSKINRISVSSDSLFPDEISAFVNLCNANIGKLVPFLQDNTFIDKTNDLRQALLKIIL